MATIKTMNINFPLQIELQDGQVKTSNIQSVSVVCQSNRIIIDISQLKELHPLEAEIILDSFANQLSISSLFDYLILANKMDEAVADMFAKIAGTRLYNDFWKRTIIAHLSTPFPKTMSPLRCDCAEEQLPNPYGEIDLVTRFIFYREP